MIARAILAAALAALTVAPVAGATAVRVDGDVLVVEGDDAVNRTHVDAPQAGRAFVTVEGGGALVVGAGCQGAQGPADCRGWRTVLIRLGAGDDEHSDLGIEALVTVDAGDGADDVGSTASRVTVDAGSGDDDVEALSNSRASVVRGGEGDDELYLGHGGVVRHGGRVEGGPGDDWVRGGRLVFGGPGRDLLVGGRGGGLHGGPDADTLLPDFRAPAFGGAGDDWVESDDGRLNRVDCGAGRDVVLRDGRDRVRGCEHRR